MLPDVGAGAPMTPLWFVAAMLLLGMTVISGVIVTIFSRALKKKDDSDKVQNDRITALDTAIREQELKSLERDSDHQKAIYQLQVDMLRCQKETCARSVTKEEYLGDFLRIQNETRDAIRRLEKQVSELVTRVHERIDAAFAGNHEGQK